MRRSRRAVAGAALLALWQLRYAGGACAEDLTALGMLQPSLQEVTISADRLALDGTASTASEGSVSDQELQLTPIYRPGQLLETVPGLIATLHSGEGKANQYLLRGYNLDHGTDLATFVDGMPVNQPTHAHGQGYTDLNFLIPELVDRLNYTKGPYYADIGDFGGVGSVDLRYRNSVPDQISMSLGSFDFQRYFAAGSRDLAAGQLLAAAEVQHYDGPFANPDDARKENLVLRYSQGDGNDGYSVTGMYYHQLWNSSTDIPLRAVVDGLVADRFGTLDPSDGGRAQRASLSARYDSTVGGGRLSANGFFEYNQLHIYNDFTHFLLDPVHGDQEMQFENRRVFGGALSYVQPLTFGGIATELTAGGRTRYDLLGVGRLHVEDRVPLPLADAPPSYSDADQVYLFSGALYLQAATHWTPWLRTVVGLRDDYQHGTDVDYLAALHESVGYSNGGRAAQSLLQPKASIIYTPGEHLELYASAGEGFHSADLRGVNQDRSVDLGLPNTPLLARQEGEELGVRASPRRDIAITFAVFNLWQQSETVINPDVGQDVAGPPSRRYGFELNLTYQLQRWLEIYASYSGDHTRFTRPFDDGTGHEGTFISDAPRATGSLALYWSGIPRWSGGLEYRYLGGYPLSSGPCVDAAVVRDFPRGPTSCANAPTAPGQVNGQGFGELNFNVLYGFASGWTGAIGIYNLLDSHAPAAEFWYVDRLRSEVAAYPDGRADIHEHPLEPAMVRVSISRAL